MKKFLNLLLIFLLVFSLFACQAPEVTSPNNGDETQEQPGNSENGGENSENGGENNENDQPNDQPSTPEPTLEEKKQALKEKLIAQTNNKNTEELKSPTALLDVLDRNFSITQITNNTGWLGAPVSVYHKNGALYQTYDYYQSHSVGKNDLIFIITHENGSSPSFERVFNKDSYPPALLTAFHINGDILDSMDLDSLLSDSGETANKIPPLTAEHLTISDNLTTCTISEEYLKDAMLSNLKENGDYTQKELDDIAQSMQLNVVYSFAENKGVFSIKITPPDLGSEITAELVFINSSENGKTMEIKFGGIMESNGIPVHFEALYAMRNIKYRGADPISGDIEIKMVGNADETKQGHRIKVNMEKSFFLSADLTNSTAPKFELSVKDITETRVDGQLQDSSMSLSYLIKCNMNSNSNKNFTYAYKDGNTLIYSLTGKITFTTPTVNMTIPEPVRKYVEEIYSSFENAN